MNEVRGGGAKDAADFATGFVKGNLESVDMGSLANVCKTSLSAIRKDGNNDGGDYASPGNKGETTDSVTQDAEGAKGTPGTGG